MFRVAKGSTQGLVDVDEFIRLINEPPSELREFFDRESDIFIARAPGRLDVMGGIADYSGSLVLEMPIAEATFAAIQKSNDKQIKIVSLQPGSERFLKFQMGLTDLVAVNKAHCLDEAKKFFLRNSSSRWASYAAGAFFVLLLELGIQFRNGARILVASSVPAGKGVSSSAALEVATMNAVCRAYDLDLDARQIAILCQTVENRIVGAACGVMDQITSSCGVEHSLISLLCQPAEIEGIIKIPDEIDFWGIDSGVRHSVAGADYSLVRIAAFMGYRIIAHEARFPSEQTVDGLVKISDDRWGGYLANVCPEEYEREFASILPDAIGCDEFLAAYGGITDPVSTVDRSAVYKVRAAVKHAIYESSRVTKFSRLLGASMTEENLKELGKLMFESHDSYFACGLTEPRTDRIVELVRQNGADGLYGARITGGGSGGTVVVLGRRNARKGIQKILDQIENESGRRPRLFHGSSPGAARFGHIRLRSA